jgi:hypothetical protein
MSNEKAFQSYFMKVVDHGYRTALLTGGGFPDVLLIHGDRHSLVELKVLEIGPSGNRKIKGLFKPTQPPWYLDYLYKGGTRLFVVTKVTQDGNSRYGLLPVTKSFCLSLGALKYSHLKDYGYKEYKTLKELVSELSKS